MKKKIVITGAAGFIGFHLTWALLNRNDEVIGIDNLNDYYDPKLKEKRLDKLSKHPKFRNFSFIKNSSNFRTSLYSVANQKFSVEPGCVANFFSIMFFSFFV